MKPILFNTDMVRALLDERKANTRRVIQPQPPKDTYFDGIAKTSELPRLAGCAIFRYEDGTAEFIKSRYLPGDILWVRETWRIQSGHRFEAEAKIEYKAGGPLQVIPFAGRALYDDFMAKWNKTGKDGERNVWIPSIHMPRAVARIFLQVPGVWAERLQDITEDGVISEGTKDGDKYIMKLPPSGSTDVDTSIRNWHIACFSELWNSTTKDGKEHNRFRWINNPWVWAIQLERCENPKSEGVL